MRRRPSIRLTATDQTTVLIDTGPDFRDQALSFGITQLDAVFITHQHADHVMGLDDIRRFTWMRTEPLLVRAHEDTVTRLRALYPYISEQHTRGTAVPRARFIPWNQPVTIGPFTLKPFGVPHTSLPCYGIRICTEGLDVGYVPDCSGLPSSARDALAGVDVLILNALRIEPHPAHLSLQQSLDLIAELSPPRAYLTHMGCPIDYDQVSPTLPDAVHLAYDGLELGLE
jgi:phosphoribosyl 1,2-cyclic phosphate phosphodiesterase